MGYLDLTNDMVNNATKTLNNVLDSKFTTYLQGNGTPILVTYYNIDDTLSTTDSGNYTVDQILGGDSPLRYNKIDNFPIVGLTELLPSLDTIEGNLLDLSLDTEVTIFPNTIKPTPYDIFIYEYMDGSTITFKVNSFEFTSIKNNNYYKLQISLKDINDLSTVNKVENQTIKCFNTKLDTVGTQDRCIIEDKIYEEIEDIRRLLNYIVEEYCLMFYDKRYNCLLLRDSVFGYPIYDPFLTMFISNNNILDNDDYKVFFNFDYRYKVEKLYKLTLFRYLELRNTTHLSQYCMIPVSFKTSDTTPFNYYGEETVFTLDLIPYDKAISNSDTYHVYGDKALVDSIMYHDFPKDYNTSRPSSENIMNDNNIKPVTKERKLNHDLITREGLTKLDKFDKPDNISYITNKPRPEVDNTFKYMSIDDLEDIYDDIGEDPLDNTISEGVVELLPPENTDLDISDIYEEDLTEDTDFSFFENINEDEDINENKPFIIEPFYLNIIRDYLVKNTMYKLFSDNDFKSLMEMDIQYNETDFIHIPMLIFVLRKYIEYLLNNK